MINKKGRSIPMVQIKDLIKDLPSWKMLLRAISLASLIDLVLVACIPEVPIPSVVDDPTIDPIPTIQATQTVYIPTLELGSETPTGGSAFSGQVLPIFQAKCQGCHNADTKSGGWDASSYESVTTSGKNAPVLIAGDVQNSLLAQLLQGSNGKIMPPKAALPPEEIQIILDWIAAGVNK
jgi:mono/diheme cytochrome c family protein